MKELNLEVGQKLWSIQLGDCEVNEVGHDYIECFNSNKKRMRYFLNGYHHFSDACQSLFESNPFEPKLVQENKDGWIDLKESKPEMIKALCMVAFQPPLSNHDIIVKARVKLLNLLESI